MQDDKLWTIGIVNFHTIEFIFYQLEIIKNNNPGKKFNIIIVDNSSDSEVAKLNELASEYENVTIIDNTKKPEPWMRGSGQHGEGLDIILKNTNTSYLLVHDPDFFWVGKNYLSTLEKYFDEGFSCVGAPYRNFNGHDETGGIGKQDFPAAFGAAYKVCDIIDLGFMPAVDKDTYERSEGTCWLSKDGADVGWTIREKWSKERYFSFHQNMNNKLCFLGSYAFETVPYEYRIDKQDKYPIAYHLFRGSFGDDILSLTQRGIISRTDSLSLTRDRYGKFFLYLAKANAGDGRLNRVIANAMIFYRKNIYGFAFIDNFLDKYLYKPIVVSAIFSEKILYVLTHPVGFIFNKFKNK